MSMMDVMEAMRKKIKKDKKKESLPWYCILRMDKCIEPDKTCTDCKVYQKYKKEAQKQ